MVEAGLAFDQEPPSKTPEHRSGLAKDDDHYVSIIKPLF